MSDAGAVLGRTGSDQAQATRPGLFRAAAWAVAYRMVARRNQFGASAKSSDGQTYPAPRTDAAAGSSNRSGQISTSTADGRSQTEQERGRDSNSPAEIPAKGWKDILWRVYEEVGKDRVLAVAAGVTFYSLLAVFPAIAALVSIYGLVADPADINEHIASLANVLPGGAIEIVSEQVKRIASQPPERLGFSFFISLGIALWSANAGMKAVFDALNVAYGETEKRSFIKLNAQSLLFTLGAIVLLTLALLAIVVVPVILRYVGLGPAVEWIISLARWPVILMGVIFMLALLYRYGPSRDRAEWRWLTPGAILAATVWLAASMLFSWYASNFGSFNETYGSLGAVIGFMMWMWISAIIVLVGAELNAETEHQTARDSTEGPHEPMGARGATMADNLGPARG